MLAISGLDVAFVSAIAAVAAAIAAPLSAWLVAVANNRHDRWVKTYDDLRDAYLRLLRVIFSAHVNTSAFVAVLERDDPGVYEAKSAAIEDVEAQVERLALVRAFAPESVIQAVDAWNDVYLEDVASAVRGAKYANEQERQESGKAIRDAQKKLREPTRQLRTAIRTDLGGQRRNAYWRMFS